MRDLSAGPFNASVREETGTPPGESAGVVRDLPSLERPRRSRAAQVLVVCGLLLAAAVTAGTWVIVSSLHNRALADRERELRNIALVLAEQTDRAFQALDLVQTSLIERMQSLGISSNEDHEREMSGHDVHLMLKDRIGTLPHVGAVALIDARGKLINFSRTWPIPEVNVSDRDYFKALASDPHLTLFLSEPVRDRGSGTWTIFLARKFAGRNGEFLGLVVGATELQYFEGLFARIALGNESVISLLRRDGIRLVRYPPRENLGGSYGQSALFKNVLAHAESGVVRLNGKDDGKERLVAGHSLAHYPVVVAIGTTVAAALAEWQSGAIYLIGGGILLVLVIGTTVLLSLRQIRNYELLVKARADSDQKAQLDAALNNMGQGLLIGIQVSPNRWKS